MESIAISKRKWTIGKYLRKKKGLRKADPSSKEIPLKPELKEYIDYLVENGALINKVSISQFHLKNGLPYIGLIANEKILSNETLVEIPRPLLLTTKKAYFSEMRKIYIENPLFFSAYHSSSWEDHMLLVYLLNEYKKGKSSEWYHLLCNLPKDLDYVIFWDENELKKLEDSTLLKLAQKYRNEYEQDKQFILSLCSRYPDLMDKQVFTSENIQWIYTHLVTRCFGKYLEYVTMVPFAELFNHECTDVYYDLKYMPCNKNGPKQPFDDIPKELEEGEDDGFDTSDGTYDSNDEELDSDYEYDFNLKNGSTNEVDYIKDDKSNSEDQINEDDMMMTADKIGLIGDIPYRIHDIQDFLFNYIDLGDSFSIFYLYSIMKKLQILKNAYANQLISLEECRKALKDIEMMNSYYRSEICKYYNEVLGQKHVNFLITQQENLKKMNEEKEKEKEKEKKGEQQQQGQKEEGKQQGDEFEDAFDKDEDWKDDKFDYFVMKASWKDQFEKGAQVYFCYGRLSNRLMLLRYGIALEYNKYEHIHLKVPYTNEFKHEGDEDDAYILQKIQYYRLNKWKRFKLKRTTFNINFLAYCKAVNWDLGKYKVDMLLKPLCLELELKGLNKGLSILKDFLSTFSNTLESNEKLLQDPSLSYHEYFAIVYKIERQRLAMDHYKAHQILIAILTRLKNAADFANASSATGGLLYEEAIRRVVELEANEDEYQRNRVFLKGYLERLRRYWKI